jgi:hypothetical protein
MLAIAWLTTLGEETEKVRCAVPYGIAVVGGKWETKCDARIPTGGSNHQAVARVTLASTVGPAALASVRSLVYKISAKFDGVPYAAKEPEKRRFTKNGIPDQKADSEMNIMRKIKHVSLILPD